MLMLTLPGEARTEDADYHVLPTMLWPAELPVPQAQLRARPFHVAKVLANRAADRGVFVLQPEDARILAESLAEVTRDGGMLDRLAQA